MSLISVGCRAGLLFTLFCGLQTAFAEDSASEQAPEPAVMPMYGQMPNGVNPYAYQEWAKAMNQASHWYQQMVTSGLQNEFMQSNSMMNPALYSQWMSMMMNPMMMQSMGPVINSMTEPQMVEAMMRSMNPSAFAAMMGGFHAPVAEGEVPETLPLASIPGFPTQAPVNWPLNQVSPALDPAAKKNAFQSMMMVSPLSMRDMVSIMTDKMPVEDGVSWEDAVDAMKLRANEVNFKFVGSSPLWKQIEAMLAVEPGAEQPSTPKVEIFRFCDALVARKILDEVPEFVVFLPCRIALIEDNAGKLWVMTLDWNVDWLNFAQNPNSHLSKELRADAKRVRDSIRYIMEGAATGDF